MWLDYPIYASVAILCWLAASGIFLSSGKKMLNQLAAGLSFVGTAFLLVFMLILWLRIQRPPMRTLGETRLWYAIFMSGIGLISYLRWKFKWLVSYSLGLSMVYGVLQDWNGTIAITSAAHIGTTFTLYIPTATP